MTIQYNKEIFRNPNGGYAIDQVAYKTVIIQDKEGNDVEQKVEISRAMAPNKEAGAVPVTEEQMNQEAEARMEEINQQMLEASNKAYQEDQAKKKAAVEELISKGFSQSTAEVLAGVSAEADQSPIIRKI